MQTLITALIVAGCAGCVLWQLLLPAAARRWLLHKLGRPARPTPGCASCDRCAGAAAISRPQSSRPVHWLPRRRG